MDKYITRTPHATYRVRVPTQAGRVTVGSFPTIEEARTAKAQFLQSLEPHTVQGDGWHAQGVAAATEVDEEALWEKARATWERTATHAHHKRTQRICFDEKVIGIAFVGDQHLGNNGTDYPRVFAEAEMIARTPHMYAITMGDMLDQFVIGRLRQARDNAVLTISEEWVLVKRYLRILAPKLLLSVGGNHDYWAAILTGVDWFREVLASLSPNALYDSDDCRVMLELGEWHIPARFRHKWQGSSIYNPTHGIERAAKWDDDFLLGVGAHTHVSGVAREMNVGGKHGLAIQVGAYKREDGFARRLGFPAPNHSTGVMVLFDRDTRTMTPVSNLAQGAKILRALHS